jgi:hypothetical protein
MARESGSPKRKCDGSHNLLAKTVGRCGGQFAGGRNETFNEESAIMTNLCGKTALVTGASRGIGRASA